MNKNALDYIIEDVELIKSRYDWWRDHHTIVLIVIMNNPNNQESWVLKSRKLLSYSYSNDYIMAFIDDAMEIIKEPNNNE